MPPVFYQNCLLSRRAEACSRRKTNVQRFILAHVLRIKKQTPQRNLRNAIYDTDESEFFPKNEMTLDCFILRSSSFFTKSDHPQSRVISGGSWYLTSICVPRFLRIWLTRFPNSCDSLFSFNSFFFRILSSFFENLFGWVRPEEVSFCPVFFALCVYIIRQNILFFNP